MCFSYWLFFSVEGRCSFLVEKYLFLNFRAISILLFGFFVQNKIFAHALSVQVVFLFWKAVVHFWFKNVCFWTFWNNYFIVFGSKASGDPWFNFFRYMLLSVLCIFKFLALRIDPLLQCKKQFLMHITFDTVVLKRLTHFLFWLPKDIDDLIKLDRSVNILRWIALEMHSTKSCQLALDDFASKRR